MVRRCRIRATYGVRAPRPPGCKNCYVADNVIEGPPPWTNEAMGARGKNLGEGVQMTGPGNVTAFNRVRGFRDGLSLMEDRGVHEQVSIDIYNNDITVGADDAIEADFCFHNCRVLRNRITNSFVGLSSQPGLGGPTYFVRNVMYNLTYAPFKLHRGSRGDVILHNTAVKAGDGMACFSSEPFDYAWFRNNLSIGGPDGGVRWGGYGAGIGMAAHLRAPGPHSSFDYDAVGTHQTPFLARVGEQDFQKVEPHGMRADLSVFEGVEFPATPLVEYEPPDLRPRAGSAVVDTGRLCPSTARGRRGWTRRTPCLAARRPGCGGEERAAADRRDEVDLALRADGFEQAEGRDLAVHRHRDVRAQAVPDDEPLADARPGALQIVDHLADRFPLDFHRRLAAREGRQRGWNIDEGHVSRATGSLPARPVDSWAGGASGPRRRGRWRWRERPAGARCWLRPRRGPRTDGRGWEPRP